MVKLKYAAIALTLAAFVQGGTAQAGNPYKPPKPQMYPAAVSSTPGEELFKKLHDQTSQNGKFVPASYDKARFFMYSQADVVEVGGVKGLKDMYSGTFMAGVSGVDGCHMECKDANGDGRNDFEDLDDRGRAECKANVDIGVHQSYQCRAGEADLDGDGKKGDQINSEHLWPKNCFGKDENRDLWGDLHNLRPSMGNTNEYRDNTPFGPGSYGQSGWDLPPAIRGDVARSIFYFAVTYYDRMPRKAANRFFRNSVKGLMQWNKEDPPDEYERRRNALVESFQGNSNPFVEHPEYIDQIGWQVWDRLFAR